MQETSPALENSWLRACTIQILKFTHQDFLFSHLLKKSTCCVQKPVKHIKWNFSDVKAVLHSGYDILFYEILFCWVKHLPKIWLLKKKTQFKVKSRSKVMSVFVFYLWHHLWQTFRTASNFLYNSSLSRNTRFLKYRAKFLIHRHENRYKWRQLV